MFTGFNVTKHDCTVTSSPVEIPPVQEISLHERALSILVFTDLVIPK